MNRRTIGFAAALALLVVAGMVSDVRHPPRPDTVVASNRGQSAVVDRSYSDDHGGDGTVVGDPSMVIRAPTPKVARRTPSALATAFALAMSQRPARSFRRRYHELARLASGPLRHRLHNRPSREEAGRQGVGTWVLAVEANGAGARRRLAVTTLERRAGAPPRTRAYVGEARRSPTGWRMVRWKVQR